jgi:hypothetical protein
MSKLDRDGQFIGALQLRTLLLFRRFQKNFFGDAFFCFGFAEHALIQLWPGVMAAHITMLSYTYAQL